MPPQGLRFPRQRQEQSPCPIKTCHRKCLCGVLYGQTQGLPLRVVGFRNVCGYRGNGGGKPPPYNLGVP